MPLQSAPEPAGASPAESSAEAKNFHSLLEEKFKLTTDEDGESSRRGQQVRQSVRVLAEQAMKQSGTVAAGGLAAVAVLAETRGRGRR